MATRHVGITGIRQISLVDQACGRRFILVNPLIFHAGEPAIIAGIAQTIQGSSLWNIDLRRTYITGFSAGAAMSVIGTNPNLIPFASSDREAQWE